MVVWLGGVWEYISLQERFNEELSCVGYPSDYASGPCAAAVDSYAISATTQQTAACWEFIKFTLSEAYASCLDSGLSGFFMSRAVQDAEFQSYRLRTDDAASPFYLQTNPAGNPYTPLSEEGERKLRQLLKDLSCVRFRYEAVLEIIQEDAEAFFAGDCTVETAANRIQSRVSLLLAEQS